MSPVTPETDDARTIAFFSDLLQRHALSPQALNWGSRASQERRFEVLAEIGPLAGASVLDVGCGLGDFFAWQEGRGLGVDYHGVDLTPAMIAAASARFPGADFRVCDVLATDPGRFDYVIASGIFYLRQHEPEHFMQRMIARLFALARKGVAFNSLSAWSPSRTEGEFYADPARTLDFCHTLTSRVALRHDYHPRDFTVHLLANDSSP